MAVTFLLIRTLLGGIIAGNVRDIGYCDNAACTWSVCLSVTLVDLAIAVARNEIYVSRLVAQAIYVVPDGTQQ